MTLLFYLLCAFALIGSLDVGYFHLYRLRLYRVPSSRSEELTHLFRTFLFLAVMLWVMCVDAQGRVGLVLPLLMVIDWVNSMIDVLLEPKSRQPLGGLPPMEYAIHMLSMFIGGAIMIVAWQEGLRTLEAPARFGWRLLALPPWALMVGVQIICVSLGLFLFEGFRFAKQRTIRAS